MTLCGVLHLFVITQQGCDNVHSIQQRPTSFARFFVRSMRPNPYPLLAQLREESPFLADHSTAVLVRYRDCEQVLRDRGISSDYGRILPPGSSRPPGPFSFLNQDDPEHMVNRRRVSEEFTRTAVAQWERLIEGLVDECLDRASTTTELDFVENFALQIPRELAFHLLGIPKDDQAQVRSWVADLGRYIDIFGLTPADIADAIRVNNEVDEYFFRLMRSRHREPGPDLVSRLVSDVDLDAPGIAAELAQTCKLLAVAGLETTVNLTSSTILALLRHPEQLAILRENPQVAPQAVEETLRYDPPFHLVYRHNINNLAVRGEDIAAGTRLMLLLGATGRDPEIHERPDEYDVLRSDKTHLSFAAGPHFCLGAALARLEVGIAVRRFAERVVAPELATDRLKYRPHVALRGLAELPVRYRAIRPGIPAGDAARA